MSQPTLDLATNLRIAASETLENLAFTELEASSDSNLDPTRGNLLGVRIDLGTMGAMELVMERPLLESVAEVLFNPPAGGMDQELITDTLKEILNIIAGRFLESLFQGKSDFVMGLPLIHLDVVVWNSLKVKAVLTTPDGGVLAVGLNPAVNAE